jgi:hypothetical protein
MILVDLQTALAKIDAGTKTLSLYTCTGLVCICGDVNLRTLQAALNEAFPKEEEDANKL